MFKQRFQCGLGWNQVKYAIITIKHVCFIAITLAGVTVSFFPSQFFPRGKNGPAHSFPGEKTDRSVFSPGERFD